MPSTLDLIPDGKCAQPSVADAQARLSSETSDQTVAILMSLLLGITENVTSGDVLELGVAKAEKICERLEIDEELFKEVIARYRSFADKARSWNPLAF